MYGELSGNSQASLEEVRPTPHAPGMSRGPRRRATYEDLEAVPPNKVGEIVDGRLYVSPRPACPHAFAVSRLHGELYGPADQGLGGPGGWFVLFEPELHLGGDALVPDLTGWRRERMPEVPATAALTLAPDWVCEVLSPSTERLDREEKKPSYAREGVRHLWLVDPLQRSLEVYRLEAGRWVQAGYHQSPVRIRAEPFELNLGRLWLN